MLLYSLLWLYFKYTFHEEETGQDHLVQGMTGLVERKPDPHNPNPNVPIFLVALLYPNFNSKKVFEYCVDGCEDRLDGVYADCFDCAVYRECLEGKEFKVKCPLGNYNFTLGYCDVFSACSLTTDTFSPAQQRCVQDECIVDGLYPDCTDCDLYTECDNSSLIAHSCPVGTTFNLASYTCTDPDTAICGSTSCISIDQCQNRDGDYPDCLDCKLYIHCENSTGSSMPCPRDLQFDSINLKCTQFDLTLIGPKPPLIPLPGPPPVPPELPPVPPSPPPPPVIGCIKSYNCPLTSGDYPYCNDCSMFVRCTDPGPGTPIHCPKHLFFDSVSSTCLLKHLATCGIEMPVCAVMSTTAMSTTIATTETTATETTVATETTTVTETTLATETTLPTETTLATETTAPPTTVLTTIPPLTTLLLTTVGTTLPPPTEPLVTTLPPLTTLLIETEPPVTTLPPTEAPLTTLLIETEAPITTLLPVTEPPVETILPETEAPVTEIVETQAPVTELPQTEAPVTEIVVTEAPVTEIVVTEAPVTEIVVTEAPVVTEIVQTEAPVTEIVETEAPVTEIIETEAPVATEKVETEAPFTEIVETEAPIVTEMYTYQEIAETGVPDYNIAYDYINLESNMTSEWDATGDNFGIEISLENDTLVGFGTSLDKDSFLLEETTSLDNDTVVESTIISPLYSESTLINNTLIQNESFLDKYTSQGNETSLDKDTSSGNDTQLVIDTSPQNATSLVKGASSGNDTSLVIVTSLVNEKSLDKNTSAGNDTSLVKDTSSGDTSLVKDTSSGNDTLLVKDTSSGNDTLLEWSVQSSMSRERNVSLRNETSLVKDISIYKAPLFDQDISVSKDNSRNVWSDIGFISDTVKNNETKLLKKSCIEKYNCPQVGVGNFTHCYDCKKYIQCGTINKPGIELTCPDNYNFDSVSLKCSTPELVDC